MNKLLVLLMLFFVGQFYGQQLNCTVTVNSQRVNSTNKQVFKTLETAIADFMNKTDWTGQGLKQAEKINCSMYITVISGSSDQFNATMQLQSSRPIFNSSYESPILNYNDKSFSFSYVEFENLIFNQNTYTTNLVSLLSFYSYMILGMDGDSFTLQGGNANLQTAQNIATIAQQGGAKGWSQLDGNDNRFFLINDLLSPTYDAIRKTNFEYHSALDKMTIDIKGSKEKIKSSLSNLGTLNSVKPNAFLTRIFFDAKSDEIVSVFSGGPSVNIADLTDNLNRVSPLNATKWATFKF
ncbi:DUF4835 family protein [Flavobacterium sp. 14A]|uniref:type IX secretion system protein PorD n=1 Tax=Flavobacterium sp. 14A TaxID=2735896 RepID=UPI00156E0F0A|nr:DUF4835 family protein [Flavobacterium sp. 14A]NRT12043.1 hypothetical protein [Flavobacterium sp. 14A]